MSEWTEGFQELTILCNRFSHYPKLFPVLAYLNYFLQGDQLNAKKWKDTIKKQSSCTTVRQCIKHMQLPTKWAGKSGQRKLLEAVNQDLGIA